MNYKDDVWGKIKEFQKVEFSEDDFYYISRMVSFIKDFETHNNGFIMGFSKNTPDAQIVLTALRNYIDYIRWQRNIGKDKLGNKLRPVVKNQCKLFETEESTGIA
jgi:hypothetical protein